MPVTKYQSRVTLALDALGISIDTIRQKRLRFYPEAQQLELAETDRNGAAHLVIPEAAKAWRELKLAARSDAIELEIVSAFRTLEDQIEIIRDKLDRGMPIERILSLSAPPGYSEHHSGRAIDINTPGCLEREEEFENTEAFRWLSAHAGRFGFFLSYPRGNDLGFIYEPWHWYLRAGQEIR